jgi:hypothetical protein
MKKIKVVATSAVTYITFFAFAVQAVVAELGDYFPSIVEPGLRVVAVLVGVIGVIRRVTPVGSDDYGLV